MERRPQGPTVDPNPHARAASHVLTPTSIPGEYEWTRKQDPTDLRWACPSFLGLPGLLRVTSVMGMAFRGGLPPTIMPPSLKSRHRQPRYRGYLKFLGRVSKYLPFSGNRIHLGRMWPS